MKKKKTLNEALLQVLEEWKTPSRGDVSTIPLGDTKKDGWVIYVKNVPVEYILKAARDLAEKSPSWPSDDRLVKPVVPIPTVNT